ncbi:LysR family transcriptional regulator [Falsibacillus albus]|uniref:LysR family transcriptional regulator n=1 Tax=Falsibacillus albus TaxID=2478915 RepID=A0A3L7K0D9_9BACI|nr:LysR family transcriptional regulator [Falsibacillus albus]RLQ95411.1 LysR family transcriptional regulator [Falsibacillus albus]
MDIKHLTYFIEVAKQKNFTKASHILHISQPALSKMIKNLEAELDVTLIDRTYKKMELTDAGKVVYEKGVKVVQFMADLDQSLYDVINLKKGTIKIGLPPIIGSLFFPGIMADFRKKYPDVVIKIMEFGAKKVEDSIEEGLIDIGVVPLPVKDDIFDQIPFLKEGMSVIVHESHPLSKRDFIHLKEVSHENFILFNEDFALHDLIIQACIKEGFYPEIVLESSQWDFLVEMVAVNIGITILPNSISEKIDLPAIKIVPLKPASLLWELSVIMKKNRYVPYVGKAFIEEIKNWKQGLPS